MSLVTGKNFCSTPFAHYVSIIANKISLKQETCPCIHSGHQSTQVRMGGCAFFVRTLSKEILGYQIVIGNVSMTSPNCKIVINAIFSFSPDKNFYDFSAMSKSHRWEIQYFLCVCLFDISLWSLYSSNVFLHPPDEQSSLWIRNSYLKSIKLFEIRTFQHIILIFIPFIRSLSARSGCLCLSLNH